MKIPNCYEINGKFRKDSGYGVFQKLSPDFFFKTQFQGED